MRRHVVLAVAALVSASCFTAAQGADVYWQAPGSLAVGDYNNDGRVDGGDYVLWRKTPASYGGAGGYNTWSSNYGNFGFPLALNGVWDSSTMNWTTNPVGPVGTQVWNPAGTDVAVFSAGSTATGASLVTVDSQTASGLRLEDGDVTIGTGTLALKTGSSINVLSGHTLSVGGLYANVDVGGTLTNNTGDTISKDGTGTLALNSANTLAGTFTLTSGTVGIGNASSFGGSTNTAGTSVLNINGGSLSNTSTNATAPIVNVVNSLKVNINGNFSVENSPQGNHLISFNSTVAGGGFALLTGNRTITVNEAPATGTFPSSNLAGLAFNNLQDGGNNFGIIKQGTGTLRFEGASTITSQFTGDVTVQQGVLEVSTTGWIGGKPSTNGSLLGGNTINMTGGSFNVTGSRATANPINNAFVISTDTKFTTSVNGSFTGSENVGMFGVFSTPNNSKITFENTNPDAPSGAATTGCPQSNATCTLFNPRFSGSNSFTYPGPIEIKNHATDTTQLTRFSNFNVTGTTITLSGVISGNGQFSRSASGAGSFTTGTGGSTVLTAANTISGLVAVTDGTLYVNNTSGSGTGTAPVTVGSFDSTSFYNSGRAILAGNGSMAGPVTIWRSGVLSPGTSTSPIAALTGGALTFTDANKNSNPQAASALPATFAFDLNSSLSTADLLNVNGNLTFGAVESPGVPFAALTASDLASTPVALTNGTKFTLMSYSGTWDGGTFAGLADDAGTIQTGSGAGTNTFRINYNDTTPGINGGTLGKYVTLTRISAGSGALAGGEVPEPTSAMLVLVGLVPLLWRRSR